MKPLYVYRLDLIPLNFSCSIKKNHQFRIVYNKGKSLANKRLVMFVLKNGTSQNHLGISVSKKVGKSVVRNRQRRLIKEGYRLLENDLLPGYDIVIIARQPIVGASFSEVKGSVYHLLNRHSIVARQE